MKIIGTTGKAYLAELDDDDLTALLGARYSPGDRNEKLKAFGVPIDTYTGKPNLIGAVIPVSERFHRTTLMEAKHAELATLAQNLRALATMLDLAATPPLLPPDQPKES